jgi:hypothetical protein
VSRSRTAGVGHGKARPGHRICAGFRRASGQATFSEEPLLEEADEPEDEEESEEPEEVLEDDEPEESEELEDVLSEEVVDSDFLSAEEVVEALLLEPRLSVR